MNYQFKYEGTADCKEAIRLINEKLNKPKGYELYESLSYYKDLYFSTVDYKTSLFNSFNPHPDAELVTSSEFVKRMKGEREWQPKWGEEVQGEWKGQEKRGDYIATVKLRSGEIRYLIQPPYTELLDVCTSIRPIQPPSLRDKVKKELDKICSEVTNKIRSRNPDLKTSYGEVIDISSYTDRIIELVKQSQHGN